MKENQHISKPLNITLWTAQTLMSALFLWASAMKLGLSEETLAQMWPWTAGNPELVIFTGILDLLAGLGLVLPMALNVVPRLSFWAVWGAAALMIAAGIFHISRGEASQTGINGVVFFLAVFVGWGRGKK